jgi:anti-sigma regulatory factor (Ser/Thr protein kinase)
VEAGPRLGLDPWAQENLWALTALPDVVRAGLAVVEGNGRRLRFTTSDLDVGDEVRWCHIDAYEDVPLTAVVRTGRPVAGPLSDLAARFPTFAERQRETGAAAVAAVPVQDHGQVLGGFVLFYDRERRLTPHGLDRLAGLGLEIGAGLRGVLRAGQRPCRPLDEPRPEPESRVALHEVGADLAQVAAARRFLRAQLRGWGVGEDDLFTAALCLTELVTNALIHTHGGCLVRLVLDGSTLRVTVRDGGVGDSTGAPGEDLLAVTGRGLRLVDALSRRWGSDRDQPGTTVWFELDV